MFYKSIRLLVFGAHHLCLDTPYTTPHYCNDPQKITSDRATIRVIDRSTARLRTYITHATKSQNGAGFTTGVTSGVQVRSHFGSRPSHSAGRPPSYGTLQDLQLLAALRDSGDLRRPREKGW